MVNIVMYILSQFYFIKGLIFPVTKQKKINFIKIRSPLIKVCLKVVPVSHCYVDASKY